MRGFSKGGTVLVPSSVGDCLTLLYECDRDSFVNISGNVLDIAYELGFMT